ncbi:ISKra4 family transposase [Nostoc sp.]|uniref:ISKra4 family transposase n=1 Tax=Nostoc sp. TaxID=1180 RepID=UPI002FFB342A
MNPEDSQRLEACLLEAASILYRNTSTEDLISFESIEKAVRTKMLEQVSPKIAFFFIKQVTGTELGRERVIKSVVGKVTITQKQAQVLGLKPYSQLSPLFEKNCLLLSGNESFQDGEKDIEALTGIKVSHSTLQRLVQRIEYSELQALQGVSEVSIDGGKVRLRSQIKDVESYWRDYKAVRLQGIYYGTFFQDNLSLTDWVNSQRLLYPLVCLGDGHDGVWNLFQEIGSEKQRQEILDWYHLKENLYKVGGSIKRLKAAESLLWQGRVNSAIALFVDLKKKPAQNFINYLKKHSERIVNYKYFSSEGLCSIGSGAVESAVKQIGKRLKISGAQWKLENVPRMLQLRAAYLNGQLTN